MVRYLEHDLTPEFAMGLQGIRHAPVQILAPTMRQGRIKHLAHQTVREGKGPVPLAVRFRSLDQPVSSLELDEILQGFPADIPKVMLAQSPTASKPAALAGVDLVLAGDTHGGQIGIPQLYRFSGYARDHAYRRGLFKVRSTYLYVNRGMGWSLRPVRFLCRPEITVVSICGPDGAKTPVVIPGDEL